MLKSLTMVSSLQKMSLAIIETENRVKYEKLSGILNHCWKYDFNDLKWGPQVIYRLTEIIYFGSATPFDNYVRLPLFLETWYLFQFIDHTVTKQLIPF